MGEREGKENEGMLEIAWDATSQAESGGLVCVVYVFCDASC